MNARLQSGKSAGRVVRCADRSIFALIIALVALGPLSTDLYLPALPQLVQALDTDIAYGQLTLTAYLVGFALGMLFYGPLADRYGRRPIIIAGLALYLIASLACVFAEGIEALLVARVVQALGAGVGPVIGRAIVRDLFGPAEAARMLAVVGSVMAIAPMLAPLAGGLFTDLWGWRANFVVLWLYSILTLGAVWRWLPETRPETPLGQASESLFASFPYLMRTPRFAAYLIANGSAYAALFAFISGSSFVLINLFGFSPLEMGLAFSTMVSGYFAATFTSSKLVGRFGAERLLGSGGIVALLGSILMAANALASGPLGIIGAMWLCAAAAGLIMPNATALALAPHPQRAGAAAALLGFSQMVIAASAGTLVGHLLRESALPMISVIAAASLASAAAVASTQIPTRSTQGDPG